MNIRKADLEEADQSPDLEDQEIVITARSRDTGNQSVEFCKQRKRRIRRKKEQVQIQHQLQSLQLAPAAQRRMQYLQLPAVLFSLIHGFWILELPST